MTSTDKSPITAQGPGSPAPQQEPQVYRRIQAAIRSRIAEGSWVAGQGIPNRTELCKEFGTTRVTLDKAIQGLVAEGVLRSEARTGTFVSLPQDAAARTLRVGVVIASHTDQPMSAASYGEQPPTEPAGYGENFYFGPLFQGVRDAVSGQRVDTVFACLPRSEYIPFCRDAELDGLVLIAPRSDQMEALHGLYGEGRPFVAVGISSTDPADALIPCEDTDNAQGARDAALHLLALGHRNIALINLARYQSNHDHRIEGFREALAEAGVGVAPTNLLLRAIHDAPQFEGLVGDWLERALAAGSAPTAIFASDYPMALATLRVLRRNGLRIPEDVSVVGFDDPLSAEHLTPALTTVRQPIYQMGRRAAERLLAGLREGEHPKGAELLPTELIVRESTTTPSAVPRF